MKTFQDYFEKVEAEDPLKTKVVNLLVKYGNTQSNAEKITDANFDYVKKTYPGATASKLAEIIRTIA